MSESSSNHTPDEPYMGGAPNDVTTDPVETLRGFLSGFPELLDEYGDVMKEAHDALDALERERDALRKAAEKVVDEYHKWSEDANDGEFALWRREDLVNAIIALRSTLL